MTAGWFDADGVEYIHPAEARRRLSHHHTVSAQVGWLAGWRADSGSGPAAPPLVPPPPAEEAPLAVALLSPWDADGVRERLNLRWRYGHQATAPRPVDVKAAPPNPDGWDGLRDRWAAQQAAFNQRREQAAALSDGFRAHTGDPDDEFPLMERMVAAALAEENRRDVLLVAALVEAERTGEDPVLPADPETRRKVEMFHRAMERLLGFGFVDTPLEAAEMLQRLLRSAGEGPE